jgi:hypothetical protein
MSVSYDGRTYSEGKKVNWGAGRGKDHHGADILAGGRTANGNPKQGDVDHRWSAFDLLKCHQGNGDAKQKASIFLEVMLSDEDTRRQPEQHQRRQAGCCPRDSHRSDKA